MESKMRIKKGDYVQVMAGKEAGKNARGKVLRILRKQNRIIVEGVNYIFRHTRKTDKNNQGGRIQKEAPIHISNVMLVSEQKPTRVTYRIEEIKETQKVKDAQGTEQNVERVKRIKTRYSKKTNRQI